MPRHPRFDASDPLLDARADATLDLHGFTAAEVPAALKSFLESWRRRKPGALLHVITGRGRGSPNGPVLRGVVQRLLKGELHAAVAEWGRDDAEGGFRVRLR